MLKRLVLKDKNMNDNSSLTGSGADTPALEIRHVVKSFRGPKGKRVRAVNDLSLTVGKGEIVALLGPNGAGKTVTLDMVLGLSQPDSGSLSVLGVRPKEAVRLGHVSAILQTGALLGDLTVKETVQMIASTHTNHIGVDEAISRAGIESLVHRRVSKCSGGEQQRLRFALALLPDPRLLILDEPTTGMDVNARTAFWETMRAEATEGRTIIFASHYLKEVEDFAQRTVLMAHGQIIADGSTSKVRARLGGKTITAHLDADVDISKLPGVTSVQRSGDRVELTCDDADSAAHYLLTETTARDLEIHTASLDSVFAHLTTKENS